MRCAACTRNDGLQAVYASLFGIGKQVIRHSVSRNHSSFMCNAELLQDLYCVLHRVPVAGRAHHDADKWGIGVGGYRHVSLWRKPHFTGGVLTSWLL